MDIWGVIMDNLGTITSILLGLGGVVSVALIRTKAVLKEVVELLVAVQEALEDDKIDKEEIAVIVKEATDVIGVFKKKEAK